MTTKKKAKGLTTHYGRTLAENNNEQQNPPARNVGRNGTHGAGKNSAKKPKNAQQT